MIYVLLHRSNYESLKIHVSRMFIKWDMFDEIRCGMSAKTLPSLDNNVRKIQTKGRLKFAGEASTGAHGVQPRRPGRRARRSAAASRKGRRPRIPGPR